jgi:acyl-CoA synthetase
MPDPLANLTWDDHSLWQQFSDLHGFSPEVIAVVDEDDRAWTRREIAAEAANLATRLAQHGVGAGHRVMVRPERSVRTVVAALAVSSLDAILCFAPPDGRDDLARTLRIRCSVTPGDELIAHDPPDEDRDPRDDRCVLIASTSGSTGRPKYVMHGARALNYTARACAGVAGLVRDEPIFAAIAPDSAAGYTLSVHLALALGHPLVIARHWEPVAAMERIARLGCRWTTMVPAQLMAMVEAARDGRWCGSLPLRAIAVGGSAMTAALIDDAVWLLGTRALRMFGLSECLAHCSNRLDDEDPRRLTSDGTPFPHASIEAFSPDGTPLPRGVRGQAGVSGPSLFLGYALGHGAGEEAFVASGHLLTGDEVIRDQDGYLRVVGRIKDQIIRGGYNIDPAEVEAIIGLHPAVAEVVVVPVPDDKLGERACAVVRLRVGVVDLTLDSIRATLADAALYRRKWPELLVIVPAIPRLPGGKVDRRNTAALAITCSAGP